MYIKTRVSLRERCQSMMTLFLTFIVMPVLVFLGLTAQRWLFRNSDEKNDPEWELYQQRYD